jgi:hypothetical protein
MQWVAKGRAHMGRAIDIRSSQIPRRFLFDMRQKATRTAAFSSPRTRFHSAPDRPLYQFVEILTLWGIPESAAL